MGILPIRELARIPARDPTGGSGLPSPRLTGTRGSRAKASARRTRALWLFRGPHGIAAAVDEKARRVRARDRAHSAIAQDVQLAEPGRWRGCSQTHGVISHPGYSEEITG